MEEKKVDRRVRYSLMVIKQSFITLLKKKPISKITIKEICDVADVNRATFYAHYMDQYDLLHQIEQDLIDEINRFLYGHDLNTSISVLTEEPIELLDKILKYVKENAELFDLFLNLEEDTHFQQEVIQIVGNQHFASMAADRENSEYMFLFYASGSIGVIRKWLRDGMKRPTREMAELILKLSISGRSAFQ